MKINKIMLANISKALCTNDPWQGRKQQTIKFRFADGSEVESTPFPVYANFSTAELRAICKAECGRSDYEWVEYYPA